MADTERQTPVMAFSLLIRESTVEDRKRVKLMGRKLRILGARLIDQKSI
jgi:hypothetical protein